MTKQEQKQQSTRRREDARVDANPETVESPSKDVTDDLLDEIDGILEENAEDFVANFRQKNGE